MKLTDIANIRLHSHQIANTPFKKPEEIVGWMGAMQSQDYNMSKWAIGMRLEGTSVKAIEDAIDKGRILRTHLMRPTWHMVSSEDIYWLLELTAPRIKASMKSRNGQLELTDKIFAKTHKLLEKAMTGGKQFTRDELLGEFKKSKIPIDENRAAHILMRAELDGLICSGPAKNKKQTYALLEERVPEKKILSREEALAKLAKKYFLSHGPATLLDFVWWSGLSITESKKALEMSKKKLSSASIKSETYWFDPSFAGDQKKNQTVFLLPAYDEFIIAYKDRTASLLSEHHKKVISTNGIFWPSVVVNGKVTGMWKKTVKNNKMIVCFEYFKPPGKGWLGSIEKRVKEFGSFFGLETEAID